MLETIRQYARNKLIQSGEIGHYRNKHLDYFTELSKTLRPKLWREEQVSWMDYLEREHDNLRAALEWSTCEGCDNQQAIKGMEIAANIFTFWLVRGYWSEALDWMQKLKALETGDAIENNVKTRLVYSLGFITKEMGDIHKAQRYFEDALKMAQTKDDSSSEAYALVGLGEVSMIERFLPDAETYLEKSLKIFEKLDDKVGLAIAYSRLGSLMSDKHGDENNRKYFLESLRICRELGMFWAWPALSRRWAALKRTPEIKNKGGLTSKKAWLSSGNPRTNLALPAR